MGREWARGYIDLLNRGHISLDFGVDLSIDLTILSHFSQDLMLVSRLRILKSQISLTLLKYKDAAISMQDVSEKLRIEQNRLWPT